jgi:hypothetical protein
VTPETGRWSSRHGEWIPQQRGVEEPDFAITRFDDTGELARDRTPPGHGRVLDHDDWYEVEPGGPTPAGFNVEASASGEEPDDDLFRWRHGADPDRDPRPPAGPPTGREPRGGWDDRSSWHDLPWPDEPAPWSERRAGAGWVDRPGWGEPERNGIGRDLELRRPGRGASSGRELERVAPPPEEWADEDDDSRGFIAVSLATLCWYAIPAGLYALWTLLLDAQARPGCIDPTGAPCRSPRVEALSALVNNLPQLAVALVFSTVVALLIRWYSTGWRAVTVGFAGAVVGAGAATVLFSLMGGAPG